MSTIDGRHVLAGLTAFFGVMLLVNAIFVYFALSTFGGIDTENAYRKGLHYNAVLEAAHRQAELGWQTSVAYDEALGVLSLKITDSNGGAIKGLAIEGRLIRPATDRFDRRLGSFEEWAGGHYVLPIEPLDRGAWIVDLVAQSSIRSPFHVRERLWLQPK
jgi:nitrogen fixation protein FixH